MSTKDTMTVGKFSDHKSMKIDTVNNGFHFIVGDYHPSVIGQQFVAETPEKLSKLVLEWAKEVIKSNG